MDGFMPHGHCILWDAPLLWTMVIADALTAFAYFRISFFLFKLKAIGKKSAHVQANLLVLVLFAVFITACGVTHVFDSVLMWVPAYYWYSVALIFTAIVSTYTAIRLPRFISKELKRPTEKQINALKSELEKLKSELDGK